MNRDIKGQFHKEITIVSLQISIVKIFWSNIIMLFYPNPCYNMGHDVRQPVFGGLQNNKDADRSLISAFVNRLLESIISRLALSKFSSKSL